VALDSVNAALVPGAPVSISAARHPSRGRRRRRTSPRSARGASTAALAVEEYADLASVDRRADVLVALAQRFCA
jgi:hypothetical protein